MCLSDTNPKMPSTRYCMYILCRKAKPLISNLSRVIIFSNSLSVLQSINNCKLDNSVIQEIILRLHNMSHKQIIFVGYRAMLVLEVMKRPAKSALSLQPSNLKLLYTDFKPAINKWQLVWNTAVDNKLHSINSILGEWRPAFRADRKELCSLG